MNWIRRADSDQARNAAKRMDIEFKQIYLPDLARIDRWRDLPRGH